MIKANGNGAPRQRSAAQDITPTSNNGSTRTYVPVDINPDLLRDWAKPIIAQAQAAGHVPWVGTAEWAELADGDPRKRAAVIYAALDWARQNTLAAQEERAELEHYVDQAALKQAAVAMAEMWRDRHEYQEPYAVLQERRRLVSILACPCGVDVEVVHPLTDEQFALLPDVSWVRCPEHVGKDRLGVAA